MMKKVLSFAVLVLCVLSGTKAQDIVNLRMDRQQMQLRGNVASMDESILLRKDYFREDWPQRKWFVKDLRQVLREEEGRIVTFNPDGRMLTVTYSYQGSKGPTTQCSYSSKGLLTSFTGEGYKMEARYTGNDVDINLFAETKSYAKNVDLARANLAGTPFSYVYPFDLKCRQEITDEGLVLRSSYFYVDSIMARDCEYKYNHNNMLSAEKIVDYTSGEKSVSTTQYTYDNRGFLVKKVVHSKAIDATFIYENNELGDCVKMTVERPYGTSVYTFEYQYDGHQNWTVRLEYEDGVFDNATLRNFTYHKDSGKKQAKSDKTAKSAKSDKQDKAANDAEKKAAKERVAAEKAAAKEAAARQKDSIRAEQQRIAEAERNMSKEERKAAQAQRKAAEKAAKEQAKAAESQRKAAEKERKALEKAAAKEKADAEKAAKAQAKAAEKAAKEQARAAEKERKAAEKAAKKE